MPHYWTHPGKYQGQDKVILPSEVNSHPHPIDTARQWLQEGPKYSWKYFNFRLVSEESLHNYEYPAEEFTQYH